MKEIQGFFEVTSPTLLDRLGVSRVDRDKQAQRREVIKKLEDMGVKIYNRGKLYLINESELNDQLDRIFNTTNNVALKHYVEEGKKAEKFSLERMFF